MLDEGIVFLGSALCERLEPVRVVRHTVFLGPLLHATGHIVGYRTVQRSTVVDSIHQFLIYVAL